MGPYSLLMKVSQYEIAIVSEGTIDILNEMRRRFGLLPKEAPKLPFDGIGSWLISRSQPKVFLGYINIVPTDSGPYKDPEIGFALLPEFQNQKIMSSVLPTFVRQLSMTLYSYTDEKNLAAIKVLTRAGFRPCKPIHSSHTIPSGETVMTAAFRFEP